MQSIKHEHQKLALTTKILLALLFGITTGIIINQVPHSKLVDFYFTNGVLEIGGEIFIILLKMLVVPIVFVSLVSGVCNLGDTRRFGALATKTLAMYLVTTAIAISSAVAIAHVFKVGSYNPINSNVSYASDELPSLKATFINIFPENPFASLSTGNMLQVILFAILLGLAINNSGESGNRIKRIFDDFNNVTMRLMYIVIRLAPFGVFCLVSSMFARTGFHMIAQLLGYFLTVVLMLFLHLMITYPIFLKFVGHLSPIPFFRKIYPAMLFSFSTSSSNASIPIVMETVERKLGVSNSITSFVIPLGATINMDGTAIMQGVATVFIANTYNIDIGFNGYVTVVITATLASIGTAGVPSVGLITLTMVLQQVGLPVQGIALIVGVDRLLDMMRTAVNITGDSAIACIIGNRENSLDHEIYDTGQVEIADDLL